MSPTRSGRKFVDLYIREMQLAQNDGHAHRCSAERGITYSHYLQLEPAYMEYWGGAGHWGGPYPPLPDDLNLLCPWDSKEELEARIAELKSLVRSE